MTEDKDALSALLERYDERLKQCPVNHPKARGKIYGAYDLCERCGAIATGSCGVEASASFELVASLRALTSQNPTVTERGDEM